MRLPTRVFVSGLSFNGVLLADKKEKRIRVLENFLLNDMGRIFSG